MGQPIVAKPELDYKYNVMTFDGTPDILPVEVLSNYTLEVVEQRRVKQLKEEKKGDEMPRSVEQLANIFDFDYENAGENDKKDFLTRFKLIRRRRHEFSKPIAAIFNPAAGRANDLREQINTRCGF